MAQTIPMPAPASIADQLRCLQAGLGDAPADRILAAAAGAFPGRLAIVSSFGTQSAVLLHLASRIDAALPVIFLDTGKLFAETLRYRDLLVQRLGLRDVRSVPPDAAEVARQDPLGGLWLSAPDACCALRKARPQARALEGFDIVVTGRKRYQTTQRARLPVVEETADGRVRLNPLAGWDAAAIEAYRLAHGLPPHPLAEQGYPSIGCRHCTDRVAPGEDPRAGRWRGTGKVECGMHPRERPVPTALPGARAVPAEGA
ncbi:phosphoadenylyl-sulfate reductase [Falsiroseomonas ponticola]|uniref:phosphoadenylyl-sulfate reductase n=1 Tax=Falsiroseomonas ponticola TaxID=2786951 RepID=UPI001CF7727F|nr:phosphoadenylyl-sulfate reductase [Roseomonas ponticola]